MPAAYLAEEQAEIIANKKAMSPTELNTWYDGSPIKSRIKKACMRLQKLRCCYCKKYQDSSNNNLWDLEHILCEKDYPEFFCEPLNLAVACKRCNGAKGQQDVLHQEIPRPPANVPGDASSYTIPHPHLTHWDEHLRHTAYIIYEAISPQGEELKKVCRLNEIAEAGAGIAPGAIHAATATNFFNLFGSIVPNSFDKDAAVRIMDAGARNEEQMRADRQLIKLDRDLASAARKASKKRQV